MQQFYGNCWTLLLISYYVILINIPFIRIFLSSTAGSGNLNNLKGGPYYILQPGSALIFLIWSTVDKPFCILSPVKTYVVSIQNFNQRGYALFSIHLFWYSVLVKIVKSYMAQLFINLRLTNIVEEKNA